MKLLGTLIAGFAALASTMAEAAPQAPIVKVAQGSLRGVEQDGVDAFRGIAYAAPPIGDRRWRDPARPASWSGVRDATAYGARCMQPPGLGFKKPSPLPMSEDCLFLNVMRPTRTAKGKLPVMVWIHGGGMMTGTGAEPSFNGPAIPASGVILVTINYRLGRLGFFAHPALSAASRQPVAANFGLLDQIAALKWVRANIRSFGGDPSNVTIFGESAGATSVDALMASPLARGLFAKAIASSANARMPAISLKHAEARGATLIASLGIAANDVAALRAIPAEKLMTLPGIDAMGGEAPVIDGVVLKDTIIATFAKGEEAPVPYIVGSNDYELPKPYQTPDLAKRVRPTQADWAALTAAYGSKPEFADRIYTDAIFSEPARTLGNGHARRAPTWRYRFAVISASAPKSFPGASHASDVGYVFQTLGEMPWPTDERDQQRAREITAYWVQFAKTGNPNGRSVVAAWPKANGDNILIFANDGPKAQTDPWAKRLDIIAASEATSNPVFVLGALPITAPVPWQGPYSLKTPIGALLADPASKAVLDADAPSLINHPKLDQLKSLSLEDVSARAPVVFDAARMAKLAADLGAIKR